MSIASYILADHLNKIQAGRPVVLEFPAIVNGITPTKLALAFICMGYGLNKLAELCLQENK